MHQWLRPAFYRPAAIYHCLRPQHKASSRIREQALRDDNALA